MRILWRRKQEPIVVPETISHADLLVARWHHLSVNAWLRLSGPTRVKLRDIYYNQHK